MTILIICCVKGGFEVKQRIHIDDFRSQMSSSVRQKKVFHNWRSRKKYKPQKFKYFFIWPPPLSPPQPETFTIVVQMKKEDHDQEQEQTDMEVAFCMCLA